MINYLPNVLILFGVFALLGISFGLVMGQGGLFSMATGMVFGIGAYSGALLTRDAGFDLVLALVAAAIIAAVASVLLAYTALRLADMYFVVATLAIQIGSTEIVHNLDFTGASVGLVGIPRPQVFGVQITSRWAYAWLVLGMVVLAALLYRYITTTQLGTTLRAMREDPDATMSVGRNISLAKLQVFAISSGIAAVAGVLFAAHLRYISPLEFTLNRSVEVLEYSILGGIASVPGPIVGAAVSVALPEVLGTLDLSHDLIGGVRLSLFAIAVLLLLRFRPKGLITGDRRTSRRPRPEASTAIDLAGGDVALATPASEPLRCEGVVVRFGGQTALSEVSVSLAPGKVVGLVGPNGAGKTTLFNVLTGMVTPQEGAVFWNGNDISRLGPDARARLGIARSFQHLGLFLGLTALENVSAAIRDNGGRLPRGRAGRQLADEKAMRILEVVGLADHWNTTASELGYAQQKMLMMGRLVAMRASCYLLDEPMAGMDRAARQAMVELVKRLAAQGAVVCLVEHSLEVIRGACDEAIFLGAGKVLRSGPAQEITRDEELVASYFGR
jgi:branched-chain amino acid transport system permease protein